MTTAKIATRANRAERPLSPKAQMEQAAKTLQSYLEENQGYLEAPLNDFESDEGVTVGRDSEGLYLSVAMDASRDGEQFDVDEGNAQLEAILEDAPELSSLRGLRAYVSLVNMDEDDDSGEDDIWDRM
jgi:hypothetical protein